MKALLSLTMLATAGVPVRGYDQAALSQSLIKMLQSSCGEDMMEGFLEQDSCSMALAEFISLCERVDIPSNIGDALAEERPFSPESDQPDDVQVLEVILFQPNTTSSDPFAFDDLLITISPDKSSEQQSNWITAWEVSTGDESRLDLSTVLDVPVLVLETHGRLAFEREIEMVNEMFKDAGLSAEQQPGEAPSTIVTMADGSPNTNVTVLERIEFNHIAKWYEINDFFVGSPEVYAITTGIKAIPNKEGTQDIQLIHNFVALECVKEAQTVCEPSKPLFYWDHYTLNEATVNFIEHDTDIIKDVAEALLGIVPGKTGEILSGIGDAILSVISEDDHLDEINGVEEGVDYDDLLGTERNARVKLLAETIEGRA